MYFRKDDFLYGFSFGFEVCDDIGLGGDISLVKVAFFSLLSGKGRFMHFLLTNVYLDEWL